MQSPDVIGALEPRVARVATRRRAHRDGAVARAVILTVALGFLAVVVVVPVLAVFAKAFEEGVPAYVRALLDRDTVAALRLTLVTAALVVPANVIFGLAAGWTIGKFDFHGKTLLTAAIEIPFAVSPVISGLVFVLAVGPHSALGGWLLGHGVRVIFAWPGIALATAFVTFGYVAREVITVMEASGRDKEEAAVVLGASGWQTFSRVTLPSIRWGLLYGVVLCNARAMGEFGAVSVVSGHIRGSTNTLPLQVEMLYDDYRFSAAFAVASVLVFLAVITLVARVLVERGETRQAPDAGSARSARKREPS
jgi:sulfate/thiosulfate transport system permease protein